MGGGAAKQCAGRGAGARASRSACTSARTGGSRCRGYRGCRCRTEVTNACRTIIFAVGSVWANRVNPRSAGQIRIREQCIGEVRRRESTPCQEAV